MQSLDVFLVTDCWMLRGKCLRCSCRELFFGKHFRRTLVNYLMFVAHYIAETGLYTRDIFHTINDLSDLQMWKRLRTAKLKIKQVWSSCWSLSVASLWAKTGKTQSQSQWTVLSYKGHPLIGWLFLLWEAWLAYRKCVQYSAILEISWEESLLLKAEWSLQAISRPHLHLNMQFHTRHSASVWRIGLFCLFVMGDAGEVGPKDNG